MSLKDDFSLIHPLRVRWAECDAQGIVFNVNYYLYFDIAMTEWLRALGYEGENQIEFFTVHSEADYKAPALFDDMLDVCARCVRLGETSMTVETAIFRGEELLTTGKLVYVHALRGQRQKAPLPEDFTSRVIAYEKTGPSR